MRETQEIKIHELKIFEHFATDILAGRKTFEIRNDDRKFQEGDLVHFQAVSEENAQPVCHYINSLLFRIGYILRAEDFPGGIKDGFAIFTISPERKNKTQGKPLEKEDMIWWTNHIFNTAKEQAFNAGQIEDALEIQEAQFEIVKILRDTPQKKSEEGKELIEIKDDDLPITAAQKIICGTRKITVTPLMQVTAQALTGEPHDGTCDMFSLEDLEEIAEYLMVYCRKHKNGE